MVLAIAIFITVFIGTTVILICGKANIKRIIIPLLILLAGDFILLYAKFVVGDNLSAWLLYFWAIFLLLIPAIWLIVILIKSLKGKENKKINLAILIGLIITIAIIFIPSLKQDDKFIIYQKNYFSVSDAIFQAYDEGRVSVEDQFASPPFSTYDLKRLNATFASEIVDEMKALNRTAGVYTYILADEDVVYFSFGAVSQSIDGIAICRNGKDPSTDDALKSRFFDGCTSYIYITDDAYHFKDGL